MPLLNSLPAICDIFFFKILCLICENPDKGSPRYIFSNQMSCLEAHEASQIQEQEL